MIHVFNLRALLWTSIESWSQSPLFKCLVSAWFLAPLVTVIATATVTAHDSAIRQIARPVFERTPLANSRTTTRAVHRPPPNIKSIRLIMYLFGRSIAVSSNVLMRCFSCSKKAQAKIKQTYCLFYEALGFDGSRTRKDHARFIRVSLCRVNIAVCDCECTEPSQRFC